MILDHRLIHQSAKAMDLLFSNPSKIPFEAQESIDAGEFKRHSFSSKKIPRTNFSRCFRSLASSLKSRMLTLVSRKEESTNQAQNNADHYKTSLNENSVLDPSKWPLDYVYVPNFAVSPITALCDCELLISLVYVNCAAFR